MDLDTARVAQLADCLKAEGLTDRHRTQTRQEFETVYDITTGPTDEDLETTFKIVIQARSQPLAIAEYETLIENIDPVEILALSDRQTAFDRLIEQRHIGQKIANEFLRIAVDVLGENPDWRADLHVALDTNMAQALVKTGAIQLVESEQKRGANRIVNMNPTSKPHKLVGYSELQRVFAEAAAQINEPRIVFDEPWTEHQSFIPDPLLRERSIFSNLPDEELLSSLEAR